MIDTTNMIDVTESNTTTTDALIILDKLTSKPVKSAPIVRTVLVKDVDGNVLFEGQTEHTKEQLKVKFGADITVNYSVLYTTINATQTYEQALIDPYQVSHFAYSLEEFKQWLQQLNDGNGVANVYTYTAYSELNLKRQKYSRNGKSKQFSNSVVDPNLKASLSLYFYTSLAQLDDSRLFFPIKGVSNLQAEIARDVLASEDEEVNEFVRLNLNAKYDEIKQQQVESVLFLSGSPSLIDTYIKGTNLKWITFRDGVEGQVKGLIHSPIKNNHRVTMLLLNVHFNRNEQVMKDVGWLVD